jgi:hypothetical protein
MIDRFNKTVLVEQAGSQAFDKRVEEYQDAIAKEYDLTPQRAEWVVLSVMKLKLDYTSAKAPKPKDAGPAKPGPASKDAP